MKVLGIEPRLHLPGRRCATKLYPQPCAVCSPRTKAMMENASFMVLKNKMLEWEVTAPSQLCEGLREGETQSKET